MEDFFCLVPFKPAVRGYESRHSLYLIACVCEEAPNMESNSSALPSQRQGEYSEQRK